MKDTTSYEGENEDEGSKTIKKKRVYHISKELKSSQLPNKDTSLT
jgi:hypothetical protein